MSPADLAGAIDEAAMDFASEGDRVFFEQHQDREYHIRPFVPGELPVHGIPGDGRWIIAVRSVRPGMRIRLPLYVRHMPPDDEDVAAAVFRVAFDGGAA